MPVKLYKTIAIVLLVINSLGALAGGGGLILDPSGKSSQLSLEILKFSPFHNFLIPGIILFTVNGLFGLVVLGMIVLKYAKYPQYIIIQAILLGGWIIIQIMLLHELNFLHITFLIVALVLLVAGFVLLK